jgi:hypothetical protein
MDGRLVGVHVHHEASIGDSFSLGGTPLPGNEIYGVSQVFKLANGKPYN